MLKQILIFKVRYSENSLKAVSAIFFRIGKRDCAAFGKRGNIGMFELCPF